MVATCFHFNGNISMVRCFPFSGKISPLTCMKSDSSPPTAPHNKPTSIFVSRNHSYWASIEADIETYLKKAIPIGPLELFLKPMNQIIFGAPQTTASALCVAACELVGGDRSQAVVAASTIHIMNVVAHTREHLLFNDELKPRSRVGPNSSIRPKFGPNIELLMGDAITPFGMELVARSMDLAQIDPERILRVILEITRAMGSQGMIDGQNRELELDWLNNCNLDSIEYVCKKKEGELHACGAACGAILGGGAEEDVDKLRKYGVLVGMIYGMLAKNKPGSMVEKIENLKGLALKELESFKGGNVELISSLVEPSLFLCPA